MTDPLLSSIVVPIADEDDAAATARAVGARVGPGDAVTLVHVVEKAGGAPDKASVEQRELRAEAIFETFDAAYDGDATVDTAICYGTEVAEAIVDRAGEQEASAIVFTSRGLSSWVTFLTGDVRDELIDAADRPVVVLPTPAD